MQPGDAEQQSAPQTRQCDACGAAMERGQDWCLECGTAAPGRLGAKPGMRAAATVVSLTLALVGGAVAASYAALSTDSQQEANRPAPPSGDPVAQAPPGQLQTPAPSDALPPGAIPGQPAPPAVPPTTTPTVPTVPQTATPQVPNIPSFTPPSSTRTPTVPRVTPPSTATPPPTTDDDDDEGTQTTTTPTTTTPQKQGPQPIAIAAGAASHYDPSKRATAKGDPADAVDDSTSSAWFVTTADASKDMATGLVIDLGSKKGVRVLELATSTPGFRAEIYAADSDELPPDILDTRWAHITDRSNVDETGKTKDRNVKGDGKERVVLGGGSAKYRYVLLWITTPPDGGPTVRISDVDLLG